MWCTVSVSPQAVAALVARADLFPGAPPGAASARAASLARFLSGPDFCATSAVPCASFSRSTVSTPTGTACACSTACSSQSLSLSTSGSVTRTATPWPATFPAAAFINRLIDLAAEGFYADPANGGNRDGASWRMIGYDPLLPARPSAP